MWLILSQPQPLSEFAPTPGAQKQQPVLWIPVFLIVLLERHNWLFLQFECSFFLQSVPTSFGELCNYPYTSVTLAGGARASKCISTYCHSSSLLKMIVGVCPFVLWVFLFICFLLFFFFFKVAVNKAEHFFPFFNYS